MTHGSVAHRFPVLGTEEPEAGKVPPKSVKFWPVSCLAPTSGSTGIGNVDVGPEHVMPAHGSAVVSEKS